MKRKHKQVMNGYSDISSFINLYVLEQIKDSLDAKVAQKELGVIEYLNFRI